MAWVLRDRGRDGLGKLRPPGSLMGEKLLPSLAIRPILPEPNIVNQHLLSGPRVMSVMVLAGIQPDGADPGGRLGVDGPDVVGPVPKLANPTGYCPRCLAMATGRCHSRRWGTSRRPVERPATRRRGWNLPICFGGAAAPRSLAGPHRHP